MKADTHHGQIPVDQFRTPVVPASPLVEATLSLIHDLVRTKLRDAPTWAAFSRNGTAAGIGTSDIAAIEARILSSGHRFAWSAAISVNERPDAYRAPAGAEQTERGFSHPQAPQEAADTEGRALRGVGDNVVRHDRNLTGIARYIRSNEQVLAFLTDGVPPGTVAIIDDSGGTLTAPIIEQFAGVICAGGTVRSHLGILTREYNIPCLMNAKIAGIRNGDRVELEISAAAKTTEDYQQNRDRIARVWLLAPEDGQHAGT